MPLKSENQRERHRYDPAIGVKTDFETLLQNFASAGTVRYQKFAECWREMNMACYCAGRQSKREAREFIEQCFQIATQFWLPPSSFLVRSGALYLLYGLYYFQLAAPKVKIRVTPEQWQTITEFQEEAREQQHLDLDYVFQKMVLDKAFQYVATSDEILQNQREPEDAKIIPENMKEETCMLDDIFSSSALNQLSLVHDQYQKMKLALQGDDASEPDTSLNIVHTDLLTGIYKTLQTHKERQTGVIKVHTAKDVNLQRVEEEKLQVYTPFETLSLKKRLKQKAFVQGTTGYRRRGKRPDLSSDDSESGEVGEKHEYSTTKYSGRRPIPGLYEKDEMEETAVQTPEVHEVFCMPDLETVTPNPPVKSACTKDDTATSNEEKEVSEKVQDEGEKANEEKINETERLKQTEVGDINSDLTELEDDHTVPQKRKAKPKRKSDTEEKAETKKSKSEEVESKGINDTSKKTTPKSDKKKSEKGKSDGKKSKAKPNSASGKNEKSEATTLSGTILELKSGLEEREVTEEKGEKELTAQEKLQMKLTQRKKEARLKSKQVTKGKKKTG